MMVTCEWRCTQHVVPSGPHSSNTHPKVAHMRSLLPGPQQPNGRFVLYFSWRVGREGLHKRSATCSAGEEVRVWMGREPRGQAATS
eukprot:scaffold195516_cov37-Tisochrysis_lutea.AAC.2